MICPSMPPNCSLIFGEIEDALELKRIIHVQVNPEQRIVILVEHLAVELLVVLVRAVLRRTGIQRLGVVDGLRFFLLFLAVLGFVAALAGHLGVIRFFFLDFFKVNRHRHERAIAVQDFAHTPLLKELAFPLR